MLARVKKRVVVITSGKFALRRSGDQTVCGIVTDRACLLRLAGKFRHVAIDTRFVRGKFQFQLFIAIRGRDNRILYLTSLMTRITFQLTRVVCPWDLDLSHMSFMREFFVINRSRSGRFLLYLPLDLSLSLPLSG